MKRVILIILITSLFLTTGCMSKPETPDTVLVIPGGYEGVYAVSFNGGGEDEKMMFPEEVTGLIFERDESSYIIFLANVYEDGEGEDKDRHPHGGLDPPLLDDYKEVRDTRDKERYRNQAHHGL